MPSDNDAASDVGSGWGGARPGAGRPPESGMRVRYTVSMPAEIAAQVNALAHTYHQTPAIVIRNAILEYLANENAPAGEPDDPPSL